MTRNVSYLKEYVEWSKHQQVRGAPSDPDTFDREQRIARILSVLRDIFDVDAGLINHYFGDDDGDWIKSQGTAVVPVDG